MSVPPAVSGGFVALPYSPETAGGTDLPGWSEHLRSRFTLLYVLKLNRQVIFPFVNQDACARAHIAEEKLLGQRLLDFGLNEARHRTRAVEPIKAATGEPRARALRQLDTDLFTGKLRA